jgi:hypothetical protein
LEQKRLSRLMTVPSSAIILGVLLAEAAKNNELAFRTLFAVSLSLYAAQLRLVYLYLAAFR